MKQMDAIPNNTHLLIFAPSNYRKPLIDYVDQHPEKNISYEIIGEGMDMFTAASFLKKLRQNPQALESLTKEYSKLKDADEDD
jgi:hypothetical protein